MDMSKTVRDPVIIKDRIATRIDNIAKLNKRIANNLKEIRQLQELLLDVSVPPYKTPQGGRR